MMELFQQWLFGTTLMVIGTYSVSLWFHKRLIKQLGILMLRRMQMSLLQYPIDVIIFGGLMKIYNCYIKKEISHKKLVKAFKDLRINLLH